MSAGARAALVRKIADRDRPTLSHGDEDDLRMYFAHGADFFAAPSTFGRELEQAELFSVQLRPCKRCGGSDAYWEGDELVPERGGTGFITSSREWRALQLMQSIAAEGGKHIDLPGDVTCPRCRGRGWVSRPLSRAVTPTVNLTGSSVVGSNVEPGGDLGKLERFGRIDRWLFRLARRSRRLWQVCAGYYAPEGSLAALWVLTETGEAMYEGRINRALNEAEFFHVERDLQVTQPRADRATAFAQCDKEARNLLEEAWASLARLK